MIPKFKAIVKQNKIIFTDEERVSLYLTKHEGKIVNVSISPFKRTRTNQQNRYFHGVILKVLSDELGYTTEEMKEVVRAKFLKGFKDIQGIDYIYLKSTTELSTKEFEELNEKIRTWAAIELNINIPLPNEVEL